MIVAVDAGELECELVLRVELAAAGGISHQQGLRAGADDELVAGIVAAAFEHGALHRRENLALIGAGLGEAVRLVQGGGALVGLGLNGLGLLVLPPLFGGIGVALAQTLGLIGACLWLGWRALTGSDRLVLPWGQIGTAALACLAMGLALAPFRHLPPAMALAVLVPAGMGLYGALVWVFDIAGLRGQVMARLRPSRTVAAE